MVAPVRVALAVICTLLGVGAVLTGHVVTDRAQRQVLGASSDAVARIRELDNVLLQLTRGGEGRRAASVAIVAMLELPLSADERRAVSDVAACLGDELCDEEAAVTAARHAIEKTLGHAWDDAQVQNTRGNGAMLAGVLLCVVGLAFTLLANRVPRAEPGPTSETDVDVESMQAMLRQRSEQLYDTQLKAWEKERFAIFGEIAAGLSHGLKTPLAGIRAAAQLAETRVEAGHPAREQLADIISEVDVLVEQIRRFLQASGAGAPVPTHVEPGEIVGAIANEYIAPARERGVIWEVDVADGLGVLFVDPALLIMALRNLVENALAAAPPETTVSLSAREAERPRVDDDGHLVEATRWVELAVLDRGPGIPESVLSSERPVSTKPHGSGLGLALAKRIVARHGGALLCEPGDGGGTLVRVVLPASEPPVEAEA